MKKKTKELTLAIGQREKNLCSSACDEKMIRRYMYVTGKKQFKAALFMLTVFI